MSRSPSPAADRSRKTARLISSNRSWPDRPGKNWSVVRPLIGCDRQEGPTAAIALHAVYVSVRLWVNFFQPSMRLLGQEPRDTLCQEAILSQGAQVYRGRATHFGSGAAFAFVGGGPVLCRVSGLQPA